MLKGQITITRATADDASAVHDVVLRATRETIATDYPASVLDRLVLTEPKSVSSRLARRTPFARAGQFERRLRATAALP